MAATKDSMTLEVNGLHVHLTFVPFPDNDTADAIRAILKNSYIRTLHSDAAFGRCIRTLQA